jgi:hypothetical protein
MSAPRLIEDRGEATLCEALDRVLHKGAVVYGDIVLSVANVNLLYLNVRVFLSSIDTAVRAGALDERRVRPIDTDIRPQELP